MVDVESQEDEALKANASQRKHVQMRRVLSRMISKSAEGAKLPTVRELMRQYKVSQATADRSLQDLEDAGRIRREVGRGTFVCRRPALMRFVDIVFFEDLSPEQQAQHGFHSKILLELGHLLGDRGAGLRVHSLGQHLVDASLLEGLIFDKKMTHVVLVNARDMLASEILKREEIAHLSLFTGVGETLVNTMQIDNSRVMSLALDHLVELGHRQIGYLHWVNDIYYRDATQRREAFYRLMLERQMPFHAEWVQYGGYEPESGYEAACRLLDLPERPTAIVAGDEICPGVYKAIREKRLKVGEDVSVVGINDLTIASLMDPPLTSVRIARKRVAEMIVESFGQMAGKGKAVPAREVPCELVVRESAKQV
ncbi:substrate-binding domain-containing protein [Poriferisphaera sp. WC338]|uniref:substrate-binding domain-containing protein n=1 Tax=Poriferisphaera sp. WC338 TaxID=3425129 RepID=UPI003D81BD9B